VQEESFDCYQNQPKDKLYILSFVSACIVSLDRHNAKISVSTIDH
jgi:hypothetical protein